MLGFNSEVRKFRTIKLEGDLKRVRFSDGRLYPQLDPRSLDPRTFLEYYPFLSAYPLSHLRITVSEGERPDVKEIEYSVPVSKAQPVIRKNPITQRTRTLYANYVDILGLPIEIAEILLGVHRRVQSNKVRSGLYRYIPHNEKVRILPVQA